MRFNDVASLSPLRLRRHGRPVGGFSLQDVSQLSKHQDSPSHTRRRKLMSSSLPLPLITQIVSALFLSLLLFGTMSLYYHKYKELKKTPTIWIYGNNELTRSKRPRIWIDVETYAEGIGGWTYSLLELLHLAEILGATLVEPCMTGGRIGSCGKSKHHNIVSNMTSEFEVPISEVFDMSKYKKSIDGKFPTLATYDDYQGHLDAEGGGVVKLCMTHVLKDQKCSIESLPPGEISEDKFHQILRESKGNFVLNVENYFRHASHFKKLCKLLGVNVNRNEMSKVPLPFHPKHIQFVDEILQRANMTDDNFSAIHWRAERKGMDFMKCARVVADAKHAMVKKMRYHKKKVAKHKFLLLSSLNEDTAKMWEGSRIIVQEQERNETETVRQAMSYLRLDNGFVKIDDLLKEQKLIDSGMLAVYDLIISTKAWDFATCSRGGKIGCGNEVARKLCEECNHVGKFGRLANTYRSQNAEQRGSSWECWPMPKNTTTVVEGKNATQTFFM